MAETDHDNNLHELKNAHIIAVAKLDKHKACLRCKARVEPSSNEFRRCSKADCRMLQHYDFCTNHISVKLVLMADEKIYTLSAYDKFVEDLASVPRYNEVCKEAFLNSATLKTVIYNNRNVKEKEALQVLYDALLLQQK